MRCKSSVAACPAGQPSDSRGDEHVPGLAYIGTKSSTKSSPALAPNTPERRSLRIEGNFPRVFFNSERVSHAKTVGYVNIGGLNNCLYCFGP